MKNNNTDKNNNSDKNDFLIRENHFLITEKKIKIHNKLLLVLIP